MNKKENHVDANTKMNHNLELSDKNFKAVIIKILQ